MQFPFFYGKRKQEAPDYYIEYFLLILLAANILIMLHISLYIIKLNPPRQVNLHAPTGKRTTMNESNTGALGIPELRAPVAMNFHNNRNRKLSVSYAAVSTFFQEINGFHLLIP